MNKAIPFVIGAAAGSLITWLAVKQYYKRIADEEIESVVERFKDRSAMTVAEHTEDDENVTTATYENTTSYTMDREEYSQLLEDNRYSTEPGDENYTVFMGDQDEVTPPFVIAPEDFGDEGYDTKSFKYYADSILTDDEGEIVSDPESIIGTALSKFGVYEEDAVHVRDIEAEIDYEIIKVDEVFADINRGTLNVDSYE